MLKHVRLSYPLPFPESPGVHPCSFTTFRPQAPNDRRRKSVVGL
ncbi:TPA: aldose epimerase [Pseudomonas aeruginosa]|uniref:Aldose epimerase n=1 Tax=Pseudomonas aeruginosa TaxID=287 RepID=A0ABD7K3T3_PSEAI|nr:aldose epimerase [Pseudomonas paraeruginosa]AYZ87998.1 aldose epimerase [Pseudomonas aeruginosa]KAB0737442.1 aldose epimerase [Pseudomonas aeruginosa]MCO3059475.1 aldose epimerase [Pseudomonas aeruginosa]MCO3131634.1 aldose epimerase [Pseudomonas aeruginosa]